MAGPGKDQINLTPNSNGQVDDDLSELLDSSLQDFGKAIPSMRNLATPNAFENEIAGDVTSENFDPDAVQQAAADFQTMLKQLADVQKVMWQNMSANSTSDKPSSASADNATASAAGFFPTEGAVGGDLFGDLAGGEQDESQFAQAFLKNMQYLADKAQKVQEAKSEDEFTDAMRDLSNDETYEKEFMPFMQGLMGSLLSKDMLYPSLKEMCEKYPVWLDENRSKLDSPTLERYETQLRLMQEACKEYDNENDSDTDEQKGQRFERLIITMQKMQACGHPPEDLVGSLPPGWSMDPMSGLPRVEDTEKAAEACSIM